MACRVGAEHKLNKFYLGDCGLAVAVRRNEENAGGCESGSKVHLGMFSFTLQTHCE